EVLKFQGDVCHKPLEHRRFSADQLLGAVSPYAVTTSVTLTKCCYAPGLCPPRLLLPEFIAALGGDADTFDLQTKPWEPRLEARGHGNVGLVQAWLARWGTDGGSRPNTSGRPPVATLWHGDALPRKMGTMASGAKPQMLLACRGPKALGAQPLDRTTA